MLIPFLLAILLSVISFWSDRFCLRCSPHEGRIISFAAGISITYLFLQLFPELYSGVTHLNKFLFSFVLLGFVTLYLSEKHIYQHAARQLLLEDLVKLHGASLFIYHFIIGILLIQLSAGNGLHAFLFFIPILLHGSISSITMHRIHQIGRHPEKNNEEKKLLKDLQEGRLTKLFFAAAPLYGALLAKVYMLPASITFALLGIIAGALLFLIIKDSFPKEREGNPKFFILGVILYALLIMTSW